MPTETTDLETTDIETTNPKPKVPLLSYNCRDFWLVPQQTGQLAIYGRNMQLWDIIDDPQTIEILGQIAERLKPQLMQYKVASMSRFYGEPDVKQLGRDLKAGRQDSTEPIRRSRSPTIDIGDY